MKRENVALVSLTNAYNSSGLNKFKEKFSSNANLTLALCLA